MSQHQYVTVKVHGDRASTNIVGDIIAKALRDSGLKIEHYCDVTSTDRDCYAEARKSRAGILLLEMRARS